MDNKKLVAMNTLYTLVSPVEKYKNYVSIIYIALRKEKRPQGNQLVLCRGSPGRVPAGTLG